MKKIIALLSANKLEVFFLCGLVCVSALAHGYNMLHFPYFESDEGTYLSQAWAVLAKGKLAPYTYWYDHAPMGWFFIAIWLLLTGGVFSFGFALNSGRIFMLIIHLFSSLLLYLFARKITGSKVPGAVAVILFALSPVGIYFQRRLLLDNIMMFWMLLSLCITVYGQKKLRTILLSALVMGISILSKESAIFFLPAMLFVIFQYSDKRNRWFAIFGWFAVTMSIVGMYFLYSLLKGELFPTGTLLGGVSEHVSLLGTLHFQAGRGNISIFNPRSSFWSMLHTWRGDDPFIILTGIVTTILAVVYGLKNRVGFIIGGLAICYWAFLMRGGLVLEFYVIPLVPLLALTIGYVCWQTIFWIQEILPFEKLKLLPYVLLLPLIFVGGKQMLFHTTHFRSTQNIYLSDQTTAQQQAVEWILSKSEPDLFYAIDNYAYLDLKLRNNNNFAHAEYYWKVDGDKDIKTKLLHNNPNNIDYILFTPTIGGDLGTGELKMVGSAISKAAPVTSFTGDGWYVQMWGVKNAKRILTAAWSSYKQNFIKAGRVLDSEKDDLTTSEAQSYALLRAVWMGDKPAFDVVLSWTNSHLKQKDSIFYWKWQKGKVIDSGSAPDADEDIALALLFAYKQWGDKAYLGQAREVLNGIWKNEVVTINKIPYLTAGNWAAKTKSAQYTLNPSYLAPASYRVFAKADLHHPWNELANASYEVLEQCTKAPLDKDSGVLPPEWCAINRTTGRISQPDETQPRASEYAYNAFRIPWRVGLDWRWFKSRQAKTYLESLTVLQQEWESKQKVSTAYTHDGKVWEDYESVAAYGGNLAYFVIADKKDAEQVYTKNIQQKFFEDRTIAYWDDPKNYYTQNWGWFGTAFYYDSLTNFWQ